MRLGVCACLCVCVCPSVFQDVWRTTGHYLICHLQLNVGKCQMIQGPNVCDLKYSLAVLSQCQIINGSLQWHRADSHFQKGQWWNEAKTLRSVRYGHSAVCGCVCVSLSFHSPGSPLPNFTWVGIAPEATLQ